MAMEMYMSHRCAEVGKEKRNGWPGCGTEEQDRQEKQIAHSSWIDKREGM